MRQFFRIQSNFFVFPFSFGFSRRVANSMFQPSRFGHFPIEKLSSLGTEPKRGTHNHAPCDARR
ncbi:hypothetical protein MPNT_70042 [Candidatus Methylacidithermus pantelleriae]|uniref:Uncharacterized protein n=1 Tax=Candidatus Methylacidithermus pantelleriae TaxID=2744239 RepID=A0A8J2FPQ4_9BACT|nr:hypothetical protein MPNT_70042 [Candidatus Methylacidithermus pantelleriae]